MNSKQMEIPLIPLPTDENYPVSFKLPVEDHLQAGIQLHELNSLKLSIYHLSIAASQQKDALAIILYAISLRHGWGTEANPTLAHRLLESTASEISSRISNQDTFNAGLNTIRFNKKVAKEELSLALFELAMTYRQGWGVSKSKPHAVYFLYLAAKLGDKEAQNELGTWYMRGDGVKKNKKMAAKWFRLAEAQGARLVNMQWIWKEVE